MVISAYKVSKSFPRLLLCANGKSDNMSMALTPERQFSYLSKAKCATIIPSSHSRETAWKCALLSPFQFLKKDQGGSGMQRGEGLDARLLTPPLSVVVRNSSEHFCLQSCGVCQTYWSHYATYTSGVLMCVKSFCTYKSKHQRHLDARQHVRILLVLFPSTFTPGLAYPGCCTFTATTAGMSVIT